MFKTKLSSLPRQFAYLLITLPLVFLQQNSWAQQKHCDLAFSVVSPPHGADIPYGDTVKMMVSIKNIGPDPIDSSDTFSSIIVDAPVSNFFTNISIPVGDSFVYEPFQTVSGQEDSDYHLVVCTYLNTQDPESTIVDTNPANDTACMDVTLKSHYPTGVIEVNHSSSRLHLYPNPTSGKITVVFDAPQNDPGMLFVRDIFGRMLLKKSYRFKKGPNRSTIDLSPFAAGTYFVGIRDNRGHRNVRKMVIKK